MASHETIKIGIINDKYHQNPSNQPARPYFQHQVREHGTNTIRPIPADEVPSLWHFADKCFEHPLLETDRAGFRQARPASANI